MMDGDELVLCQPETISFHVEWGSKSGECDDAIEIDCSIQSEKPYVSQTQFE